MSDLIFGLLLAVAAAMVSVGVDRLVAGGGLIVGGALLALWAWLIFGDPDDGDGDEA